MNADETKLLVLEKLSTFLERPITESDLDLGYAALGADSMDMVAISFEIEKVYGMPVLPEIFLQHNTINETLNALFELKESTLK